MSLEGQKRPDGKPAFAEEGDRYQEERDQEEKAVVRNTTPDQGSWPNMSDETRWRLAEQGAAEAVRRLAAQDPEHQQGASMPEGQPQPEMSASREEGPQITGSREGEEKPPADSLRRHPLVRQNRRRVFGAAVKNFALKTAKRRADPLNRDSKTRSLEGIKRFGGEVLESARREGVKFAQKAGEDLVRGLTEGLQESKEVGQDMLRKVETGAKAVARATIRPLEPYLLRTREKKKFIHDRLRSQNVIHALRGAEYRDRTRLPVLERDIAALEQKEREELEGFNRELQEAESVGDTKGAGEIRALHELLSKTQAETLAGWRQERDGINARISGYAERKRVAREKLERLNGAYETKLRAYIAGKEEEGGYAKHDQTLRRAEHDVARYTARLERIEAARVPLQVDRDRLHAERERLYESRSLLGFSNRKRRREINKKIKDELDKNIEELNQARDGANARLAEANSSLISARDAKAGVDKQTAKFKEVLYELGFEQRPSPPPPAAVEPPPAPPANADAALPALEPTPAPALDAATPDAAAGEAQPPTEAEPERERAALIAHLTDDRNEFRDIAKEKGAFTKKDLNWIRRERGWLRTISPRTIDPGRADAINNFRMSAMSAIDALLSDKNLQTKEEKGPRSVQIADLLDLMLQADRRNKPTR